MLVRKILLEIIVGNPCWKILVKKCLLKILVEKSKDFSTRNYNKDFQQGFATRIFHVPTKMFQQKCSIKNVRTKMFQQKCSNKSYQQKSSIKNVPSKMYQQKCSNKSCQQKSSNKDFPARIFQQGFTTRQQGFLTIISNKDFSTRIFNPCWKILVEKSLLKNPCCKILVEKSLFKILVGNPCWKIQGFFNKDCSTRNNNKDLQQWFATRIFNVPTKMFHQKCTNKNVPTKVANKNLPTRIFQQGFFNKDLQQGKQGFLTIISNKDFSTRIF